MEWLEKIAKNAFKDELEKIAGKKERGERDGTGPYKDSFQKMISKKGKRQTAGKKCPAKKK